jgi:hypothetical protein
MGAGVEPVQRADLVALLDQEIDDVAADKAGPTGDQDAHDRPDCPARGREVNGTALTNS